MNCLNILAETAKNAEQAAQTAGDGTVPIDFIWQQIISLNILEALTFISFGVVCLFYGWRVFRILVIISFSLLGLVLGLMAAEKISGDSHQIIGGIAGLVLMAVLSVPLMRWAVCILGAIAGGVLTSSVWYACGLNENYIIAGALIGIIAGGMISFIVFKIAVMLFSSFGGSALMVVGMLALLYLYPDTTEQVQSMVFDEKWFLPVALIAPTLIGVCVQNKFVKNSAEWTV